VVGTLISVTVLLGSTTISDVRAKTSMYVVAPFALVPPTEMERLCTRTTDCEGSVSGT
jgi:hypothetical protein